MSYPYPPQDQRRPSLEISRFSTLFQQWDIGAQSDDSRSPTSRRGSHLLDGELAPQPSIDAEIAGGTGARQRTTQACDKCRERKTKCSGDHPVCKRCTTRGLVCHYSERDRVRGPAKARLRTAASSPVLDTRFATDGMAGYPPPYKPYPTSMYSHPYPHAQPPSPMHEYHEHSPALPPQQQHIYQQPSRYNPISPYTIPLRGRPTLSRTSLPQIIHRHYTAEFNNSFAAAPNAPSTAHNPHPYHLLPQQQPQQLVRRVQSHSAVYRQRPPVLTIPMSMNGSESENAASPSLAYAMQPGTVQPGGSPRSESPSATASTFNFNVATASHSSESSRNAEPIPASELDLRLMAARQQQPQRGPRPTLPMLHTDHRPKPRYLSLSDAGPPLYRPQLSEALQPPRAPSSAEIQVPSINGVFGNPWGAPAPAAGSASDETSGSTANGRADVELVYPSPVTPITLARHANEHGELEPGRKRVDDDGAEAVGAAAGGDGVGAL